MDEKQLTFEMDNQHIAKMEKLLKKFRTPHIKNEYIGADRLYADILRAYLQANKNELPDFDLVDFNDMQCASTYLVQRFGYDTYILGTQSKNNDLTILIVSKLCHRVHCTLKSIDNEYKILSSYKEKNEIDFEKNFPDLNKVFPTRIQFMTILYFHIKHMLTKPTKRIRYKNMFIGPYFLRRIAATYLCKKQMQECPVTLFGNFTNSWEGLLNLLQIGTNCINAKCTPDGTLFGGLNINTPSYQHNGYFAEFIQQIKSANKVAVTKLIGALTNENLENLHKLLWLLGKIILGHQFVNAMNDHEKYGSQLTIIKGTGIDIESIYYIIAAIIDGSNYINRNANSNSNFINDSSAWGFGQSKQSCLCQILNDAMMYWKAETTIEDDILQSMNYQFQGGIANIQVEPDVLANKRDFANLLFNGKTVFLKDAYKITIGRSSKENTPEIAFSIPGGLSYTNDFQHIIITAGLTKYTKQLLEENKNSVNYINMEKFASSIPLLNKEKISVPNIIGKLVTLGMVYVINKLCLGIDTFDMIDQSTSSSYYEEKTENECIGEFYSDCIKDFTGNLDPAKIIKDTESILKENNKSYDEVDWGNTDKVATRVQSQDELKDLLTVTSSDLLAVYEKWKALKKIDLREPDWKKFSEELLSHLNIMQNQELVKYKKIFLCRKSTSGYTQAETNASKAKTNASKAKTNASKAKTKPREQQPTGMLGIQIDKARFDKLTNEKTVQEAQEKEKYEKVLSLLEAQFDDAMKEIQSLKSSPQSNTP